MSDLPQLIRTERLALIEFLDTLGPAEWATPSLCGEWTVQEVAAHIAWAPVMGPAAMMVPLAKSGFRINKASADIAKQYARRGPAEILSQLRANADSGAKPAGVPLIAGLVDAVIHAIDMRRPLNSSREVPPAAFEPVATFGVQAKWPMTISVGGSARKRLTGVRLIADGYNWSYGQGPEVHAEGEAVLRILNGRKTSRDELTGEGADQLAARLNPG
ncbi:maleylpyruvate isomerase family mycothiol-dependent enzyme [Kribbella sp. NPDC051718]|uniref:maleylpyruvate isomerase family mycothiol-dependent enzyme n=1 Tax=Kribbella sp. NPDC051718 TaxID=3155168 RepID=UPI0034433A7C